MAELIEIAWMGVTGNPLHVLHLVGAESVGEQFNIAELLIGPNGIPPHKNRADVLPGRVRLHLVDLSVEGNPRLKASSLEIDRAERTGQPSYTVDTLQELTDKYNAIYGKGNWRLNCIIGEDVIPDFKRWRDRDGIKRLARLIIIPRYSGAVDEEKLKQWYNDLEIDPLKEDPANPSMVVATGHAAFDVSSTAIRNMIKSGSTAWRYLVRDKVYEEIVRNGYYRNVADVVQPPGTGASTPSAGTAQASNAPANPGTTVGDRGKAPGAHAQDKPISPAAPPAPVDQADGFAHAEPPAGSPDPCDQADGFTN
jgi:nicotinate-nucleotide adenylyltransferase